MLLIEKKSDIICFHIIIAIIIYKRLSSMFNYTIIGLVSTNCI